MKTITIRLIYVTCNRFEIRQVQRASSTIGPYLTPILVQLQILKSMLYRLHWQPEIQQNETFKISQK